MELISKSIKETQDIAARVVSQITRLKPTKAVVLALRGELGTAKTTFVKALAQSLGVSSNITSPTFSLIKIYQLSNHHFHRLVHIDAYRLENMPLPDIAQYLNDAKTIVCVEWPENISSDLPENTYTLTFEHIDEHTRKIILHG